MKRKHLTFSWFHSRQPSLWAHYFFLKLFIFHLIEFFSARLVKRGRLHYFSPTPPSSRGTRTSCPPVTSPSHIIIIRPSTSAEPTCRGRRSGSRYDTFFLWIWITWYFSYKAEVEALQEIKTEDLEGLESEIILPVMPKVEKSMIETKTLLMIPHLCIHIIYFAEFISDL